MRSIRICLAQALPDRDRSLGMKDQTVYGGFFQSRNRAHSPGAGH